MNESDLDRCIREGMTPAEARWENEGGAAQDGDADDLCKRAFLIDPVPPFRLDLSVWALRRRPRNTVDVWDGRSYRRALVLSGSTVELSISGAESARGPRLVVALTGDRRSRVGDLR
jgi:hypothetical protein